MITYNMIIYIVYYVLYCTVLYCTVLYTMYCTMYYTVYYVLYYVLCIPYTTIYISLHIIYIYIYKIYIYCSIYYLWRRWHTELVPTAVYLAYFAREYAYYTDLQPRFMYIYIISKICIQQALLYIHSSMVLSTIDCIYK